MTLAPDISEIVARARSDLRMGVPVVLSGEQGVALILAAETLDAQRLADLRALGGHRCWPSPRGAPKPSRRGPMMAIWRG